MTYYLVKRTWICKRDGLFHKNGDTFVEYVGKGSMSLSVINGDIDISDPQYRDFIQTNGYIKKCGATRNWYFTHELQYNPLDFSETLEIIQVSA